MELVGLNQVLLYHGGGGVLGTVYCFFISLKVVFSHSA